ncbi:MAG TPA: hypothetical protein ENG05_03615 [Acidilobales archaeon]|nr:hypothetical protein [Acidilobales archaeon]
MGLTRDVVIYIVISICLILSHYVIPYTILKGPRGFTLFLFWSLLVLAWIVTTIVFVERRWFK